MIILKNNHFDDSKNWKNLAIKGIRCKIHFLITAHHQFLSFTRMSVICYPHKPPLSTKQVATLKFHDLSFAKQTSKPSFSSYSGFADTSQPLDFGLCYVFPAGEKYGGISSHFIHRLKIATMNTRSTSCGEYLKLVKFYFLLHTSWLQWILSWTNAYTHGLLVLVKKIL